MHVSRLFFLLCYVSGSCLLQAQTSGIPSIQNYKPRNYKASSANYDVIQDGNGLMYFANFRGVLEFDAVSWRLYPLKNGAAVRSLARDSLGNIYVGGIGEMGYLAPDSLGNMSYHSLLSFIDTTFFQLPENVAVLGSGRGAWFRGYEAGQLYHWNRDTLIHYPVTQTSSDNKMFLHHGQLWVHLPGSGVQRWEDGKFVLVPGSEGLAPYMFQEIVSLSPDRLLAYDREHGFIQISIHGDEIIFSPWANELDANLPQHIFSVIIPLNDGNLAIGTIMSGLFILSPDGSILQHLTDEVGLQDDFILNGYHDPQGILWLTLSKGISKIDISAPLSQWNTSSGLNGVVFSAIHHQGHLYASTTLGVYGYRKDRFTPVTGLGMESWKLVSLQTGQKHRLIACTARGLYEIEGLTSRPVPGGNSLFAALPSQTYPGHLFTLSASDGVELLSHDGRDWRFHDQTFRLAGRYSSIIETDHHELWVQEMHNPLILHRHHLSRDSLSITASHTVVLPDSFPMPQGMYIWRGEVALATEKGIWIFDRNTGHFAPETSIGISGMNQRIGVLRLSEDREGRVWIERYLDNKRWLELAIPTTDNSFHRDSVALRELSDIEVWGEVYYGPNKHAWIGTPEGLYAYNTNGPTIRAPIPRPLIRQVVYGEDSVLYHGYPSSSQTKSLLPYQNNSLTFHFSAPCFSGETEIQYSVFLEGKDQDWSPWKREFKKDYTLLPPGRYVFRVKARNMYAEESAETSFAFTIEAPWYRTPWAVIGYIFFLGLLIYGTVKLNTRRLHAQNEHLETIVYERTSEIWAQHKEIIRKSAELKRQKEAIGEQHKLLGQKNQELEQTLSQLKSAQSKLVESEKMASLGQLTAGIAHEINNPINFVKGNVGPLKRDFQEIRELFTRLDQLMPGEKLAQNLLALQTYCEEIDAPYLFEEMALLLDGIEEGAQRTKQIVDGLQIFSRSDTDSFRMADVHQGLESTLTLLSNSLKQRVQVHRSYSKLPQIECMPGKLNQVFMNIMSNAIQAMEAVQEDRNGDQIGELYITTASGTLRGEPAIAIDIRDTGPGISSSIESRIFDPFFTTKDVGQGTGLGLSISFGIIDKHRGQISVVHPEAGGVQFRITLPQNQSS